MNLQKLPGAPGYMVEVGDTQQQTNQNVINVLQTVVSSVQEQQAGQRKLLERTKPKKVVGHLWWKKEVEVEEDSDVQDITAEEIK